MTTLHAQPYDLAAAGFYFENAEEYAAKSADLRNDYGEPVEEFEIHPSSLMGTRLIALSLRLWDHIKEHWRHSSRRLMDGTPIKRGW